MKRNLHRKSAFVIVLATALLAATFVGTTQAQALTKQRVLIGIGDSYTSGEGASPFGWPIEKKTQPVRYAEKQACHQSVVAYPLVAGGLKSHMVADNFACSGAKTGDLFTSFKVNTPQAARLSHATDIVLTIGGNDINALGSVSNPPTPEEFAAKLAALAPKLVVTYKKIQAVAPKANLYVMGYPVFFAAGNIQGCPLSASQRAFFIQSQVALNSVIQRAAVGVGAKYVDDSKVFAGHELCTRVPFINGIGIDPKHPEYSLHPNQAGQIAMGVKLKQAL